MGGGPAWRGSPGSRRRRCWAGGASGTGERTGMQGCPAGLRTEGLFRRSASVQTVREIQRLYNQGEPAPGTPGTPRPGPQPVPQATHCPRPQSSQAGGCLPDRRPTPHAVLPQGCSPWWRGGGVPGQGLCQGGSRSCRMTLVPSTPCTRHSVVMQSLRKRRGRRWVLWAGPAQPCARHGDEGLGPDLTAPPSRADQATPQRQ